MWVNKFNLLTASVEANETKVQKYVFSLCPTAFERISLFHNAVFFFRWACPWANLHWPVRRRWLSVSNLIFLVSFLFASLYFFARLFSSYQFSVVHMISLSRRKLRPHRHSFVCFDLFTPSTVRWHNHLLIVEWRLLFLFTVQCNDIIILGKQNLYFRFVLFVALHFDWLFAIEFNRRLTLHWNWISIIFFFYLTLIYFVYSFAFAIKIVDCCGLRSN